MAAAISNSNEDLEQRVLRIIARIKRDRNRPCLQSIREKLEREKVAVAKEDLRVFLNSLLDRGVIINSCKEKDEPDKESFIISSLSTVGTGNPCVI